MGQSAFRTLHAPSKIYFEYYLMKAQEDTSLLNTAFMKRSSPICRILTLVPQSVIITYSCNFILTLAFCSVALYRAMTDNQIH